MPMMIAVVAEDKERDAVPTGVLPLFCVNDTPVYAPGEYRVAKTLIVVVIDE